MALLQADFFTGNNHLKTNCLTHCLPYNIGKFTNVLTKLHLFGELNKFVP